VRRKEEEEEEEEEEETDAEATSEEDVERVLVVAHAMGIVAQRRHGHADLLHHEPAQQSPSDTRERKR